MNIGYFVALDSPYGARTSEAKESPKLANLNLNGKAPFDIPVQAYEDETEVPKEFLIKNPREIPSRIWGQHKASEENDVVLPVIDMSPLMHQAADSEGAKKAIEEIGKACEEWGYFQITESPPTPMVVKVEYKSDMLKLVEEARISWYTKPQTRTFVARQY